MDASGYEVPAGLEIAETLFLGVLYLGFCLYLIYDPEALGDFIGSLGRAGITCTTPAPMVRFAGCGLLTLPVGVVLGTVHWLPGLLVGVALAIVLYWVAGRVWPL